MASHVIVSRIQKLSLIIPRSDLHFPNAHGILWQVYIPVLRNNIPLPTSMLLFQVQHVSPLQMFCSRSRTIIIQLQSQDNISHGPMSLRTKTLPQHGNLRSCTHIVKFVNLQDPTLVFRARKEISNSAVLRPS